MTRMHASSRRSPARRRPDTGITVAEFARRIGVTRVALSRALDGRAAIGAEVSRRLAAAPGVGAGSRLPMRAGCDRWQAGCTVAKTGPLHQVA